MLHGEAQAARCLAQHSPEAGAQSKKSGAILRAVVGKTTSSENLQTATLTIAPLGAIFHVQRMQVCI